jgi:hypothetical protein
MTDLMIRTANLPAVPTHSQVGTVVPTEDRNPNQFRVHAVASAIVMGIAGLGAGWAYASDYTHADLSAGTFLLSVLTFSVVAGHHTVCEQR